MSPIRAAGFGMRCPHTEDALKVLVTGCARSGTKYIALLLRMMKLDVGHESLGRNGIASWYMAVDSETVPIGPASNGLCFHQVFHQIRHPLVVIPSLTTLRDDSWAFIAKHIPISADEPILMRCAKYWYYWNVLCEGKAHWSYRLEELPTVFDEFCRRLGATCNPGLLARLPRDINTRKLNKYNFHYEKLMFHLRTWFGTRLRHLIFSRGAPWYPPAVTWAELASLDVGLTQLVRAKAAEYGYET